MKIALPITLISTPFTGQFSSELAQLPSTHTNWLNWQFDRCRIELTEAQNWLICQGIELTDLTKLNWVDTLSATNIEHAEWREPPNWRYQSSKALSPFACTFWLSIPAFAEDLCICLDHYTCVLGGTMILPYLTVKFRKEHEQIDETRHRAACMSIPALFNRRHLYMRTHKGIPAAAGKRDYPFCCHFMIIFDNARYEGWEITADKDGKWTDESCTMKRIFLSTLYTAGSVKDLYTWICEIHCWGATKYGPACMEEIRTFLMASSLKQTSKGELIAEENQQGT